MAALMETAPSSGERTELSEPIIPPIGVRAEPAMTMSLFMDFILLQQNLVCILGLVLFGLVGRWLGLPAFLLWGQVRGVWGIFLRGKTTRFAQTSFSLPEKYPTPPYRRAAQEC